jgi:hypothetical protein
MHDNKIVNNDEVSIKQLLITINQTWQYLKKRWMFIVVAGLIGSAIGFIYAQTRKPVYAAESTFVLEEANGNGLGQLAGLASVVGVSVGGNNSGIFQGDNIIELYKSRLMIRKTLLTPIKGDNGNNELLIERYIKINKLREQWNENSQIKNINFNLPESKFTIKHDSLISQIIKDINTNYLKVDKPDKKLNIISVIVSSPDQLFSASFVNAIVDRVNTFYVQTKTKKSQQDINLLQFQADSVRNKLNSSISGSASAVDLNPNPNPSLQVLRVPSQKRQIDVSVNSAIYTEITKNLEIAKIQLRKETPLIQIIDSPILPLDNLKVRKGKAMVIGFLLCIFLSTGYIIAARFFKTLAA